MDDELPPMHLSHAQASAVVGLERAGASLSMIGVFLIIVTFVLFKRLRTVPNTFILFASIANIGASTASLIGLTGIAAGNGSSLCRAQAFLLEMFMQADPWWSFAMAFNVYLVFFHAANPTTFRRYLWVYCTVCFGLPMIPAIVCLYIYSPDKGPVYGDATLWCWIGDRWNALRIYSYYIPIWTCIFLSAVIYIAVGYHVFHQRNQLRNLTLSNQGKELSSSEIRDSAEKNLTLATRNTQSPEVYGTVTTEVQITSDVCDPHAHHASDHTPPMTPLGSPMQCPWSDDPFHAHGSTSGAGAGDSISMSLGNHNTSITAGRGFAIDEELGHAIAPPQPVHGMHSMHSMRSIAGPSTKYYHATSTTFITSPSPPRDLSSSLCQQDVNASTYRLQPQTPTIHYHRGGGGGGVHGVHGRIRATSTSALRRDSTASHSDMSWGGRVVRAWHRFRGKLQNMDPVKLAYLRTSFVFAISVLVTWTPSSINRVYNLIYPERISYGLNIASAAVLPLQGVWNAIIYFSTSWKLLREEVVRVYTRSQWVRRRSRSSTPPGSRRRIPGIIVDSHAHGVRDIGNANATEMGTVLSPVRSHAAGLDSIGSGNGSGSQRAFAHSAHDSGRPHHHHHAGIHGMCYGDDDSTESDSLNGALDGALDGAGSLDQTPRRYRPAVPATIDYAETSSKSPPRVGTIRVQRGGQFDS